MSLSNLLNPAPATAAADTPDARKSSLPPMQGLESPRAHGATRQTTSSGGTTQDAAQGLTALSLSQAPPPASWNGYSNDSAHSSTMSYGSHARRLSLYGEGETPVELPQPAHVVRKLSSPSLDQYHVSSRSPTQQKRASIVSCQNNADFTLAPLKPFNSHLAMKSEDATANNHLEAAEKGLPGSDNNTQELGHETSHMLPTYEADGITQDPRQTLQTVAEQREPSYTRDEPTTLQISAPTASIEAEELMAERSASVADIKSEPAATLRDAIPAFTPVASLKHQHSTHASSPLREASLPVSTTEEAMTNTKKRPAPKSGAKKGTASAVGKGPPSKKRKLDNAPAKRTGTPSSQKPRPRPNKKGLSASQTPLNSSPAPRSVRTASSPPRSSPSAEAENIYSEDEQEGEEDQGTPDPDSDLYCICRRPDTGTFMIGCDGGCDDWFHGKCVGIAERDKNLIDKYLCPKCEKKSGHQTTWKRMCRRGGCRMPARVGGKKAKDEPQSKYCSDDCGTLFMKQKVNETRPVGAATKAKARKAGHDYLDSSDDLGPRGGVLSAGELKALVTAASSIDDFKRLGDGVLSPPATPSPTATKATLAGSGKGDAQARDNVFNDAEATRIAAMTQLKDTLRNRHAVLKDRIKFIGLLKQAAARLAEQNGIKAKEMCGYDSRLAWNEERFAVWRSSRSGIKTLETGALEADMRATDADGDSGMRDRAQDDEVTNGDDVDDDGDDTLVEVCTKRRCARHFDWAKLALDDSRDQLSLNSQDMRALEKEEKEIRARAGLRAREVRAGITAGSVEVHGLGLGLGLGDGEEGNETGAATAEVGLSGNVDVDMGGHDDNAMPAPWLGHGLEEKAGVDGVRATELTLAVDGVGISGPALGTEVVEEPAVD